MKINHCVHDINVCKYAFFMRNSCVTVQSLNFVQLNVISDVALISRKWLISQWF